MSATSSSRGLTLAHLRPGGRGFKTLFLVEGKMFLREPLAVFWGLFFPTFLLVLIGLFSGNTHKTEYGGLRYIDVYTPILFALAFAVVGLQVLPATLIAYREKGYLRRLSTTPVGAGKLIQAQWSIYTLLCIGAALIAAVVAKLAFSVRFPTQVAGFILMLLLTAAAMLALGTVIASVAKTPRAGQLAALFLFFYPLNFLAGLFGPLQQSFGSTLLTIAHCTPLAAAVDGIEATMAGHWPPGWAFLCLAVWAVLAGRLAVRLFRWE